MKKSLNIILILFLCAVCINGCGKKESVTKETLGGYVEVEYNLPKDLEQVQTAEQIASGDICLIGADRQGISRLWISNNYAKDWKESAVLPDLLQTDEKLEQKGARYLSGTAFSEAGKTVCTMYEYYDSDNALASYWIWDGTKENPKELKVNLPQPEGFPGELPKGATNGVYQNEMPNEITRWKFADNNSLLGSSSSGEIFKVDVNTGEIQWEIPCDQQQGGIQNMEIVGDTLVVIRYADYPISYYNIDNGEKMEADNALEGSLKKVVGKAMDVAFPYSILLVKSLDDSNFALCGEGGIFSHTMYQGDINLQVEASTLAEGKADRKLFALFLDDNGNYMVMSEKDSEVSIDGYEFDKDYVRPVKHKLKIYSLGDNREIQQAIDLFQSKNSDVNIELEIGLEEDNALTVQDVIRRLNTEIMSGNGPDVLILDGLPIDSYVEKGVLEDVSEMIQNINDEEGILKNIAGAYEVEGKSFGIPTRFRVPIIQGNEALIGQIDDLQSLGKVTAVENGKKLLPDMGMALLLERLFVVSSAAWFQEDGSLNIQMLEEFYNQAEVLYELDSHDTSLDETVEQRFSDIKGDERDFLPPLSYLAGDCQINFGTIGNLSSFARMLACNQEIGESAYKIMGGQVQSVFVPAAVIGINKMSQQKDLAGKFIECVLSMEAQIRNESGGFPVNAKAFDYIMQNPTEHEKSFQVSGVRSEDQVDISIDVNWPEEKQLQEFYDSVQKLNTPSETDSYIKSIVIEHGKECLSGQISPEEAAEAVSKKIEIYLAE